AWPSPRLPPTLPPAPDPRPRRSPSRSRSVTLDARQFAVGAFTAAAGVWLVAPSRGASSSEPRLQPRGRNLVAGFPNELEEGGGGF
uniref:Uncharacterized protein n=1 Tax=Balaenoptera musculus TaxID=9771 RepID=A0A8C0C9C7_BALMU